MLTIKKLLKKTELEGFSLLAGDENLHNQISNVNIIDNPDTYDWLSAGDFLLTTGYIFYQDPELQVRLIKELSEINCAGLGIKVKRYFNEIPQRMIDAANHHKLPLLQIPVHYTLAHVSNVINADIFGYKESLLQKSMQINDILLQCTLSGGGLDTITQKLCSLVENPIMIVDSDWNLLAYSDVSRSDHAMKNYIELQIGAPMFGNEFINSISEDVRYARRVIKRNYDAGNTQVVCRVSPAVVDRKVYGYLIVWETVTKMSRIDYVAVETATTAVAMERVKIKQIEETRYTLRQDFFDDLLQGKFSSINAMKHLAELHGLNPQKTYLCMVTKIQPPVSAEEDYFVAQERFIAQKEQIITRIDHIMNGHNCKALSIHRSNLIISFIEMDSQIKGIKISQLFNQPAKSILEEVQHLFPNSKIYIGFGRQCTNFIKISESYFQACESNRIAAAIKKDSTLAFFDDFMVYHLLSAGIDESTLEDFCRIIIGGLIEYDAKNSNKGSLVQTLEQYFAYQGNISSAARAMYIHRNTFIYRIEKIKTILNTDLTDAKECLELQLGIYIRNILQNP